MNALRQALADYLAVRRALGYKLARAGETPRLSSLPSSKIAAKNI